MHLLALHWFYLANSTLLISAKQPFILFGRYQCSWLTWLTTAMIDWLSICLRVWWVSYSSILTCNWRQSHLWSWLSGTSTVFLLRGSLSGGWDYCVGSFKFVKIDYFLQIQFENKILLLWWTWVMIQRRKTISNECPYLVCCLSQTWFVFTNLLTISYCEIS